MTVSRNQRYTKRSRCPICDGAEQDPREQSRRCIGYLSTDGDWARCSREEYAGALDLEESSGCYVHKLRGECRCGQVHGEAVTRTQDVIEAVYDYKDERGELLYQVVRKLGKRFQQRRPDPAGRDGWTWKTAGVRRVLFRLPELLAAPKDDTVVICYSPDTEVLTPTGWVTFPELKDEQSVAQYDLRTESISFTVPSQRQRFSHSGEMIHIRADWCDLLVTPEHRQPSWYIRNHVRCGIDVRPASRVNRAMRLPVSGYLRSLSNNAPSEDEVKLLAAWLADGVDENRGSKTSWNLKKDRKKARLRRLLTSVGIKWSEHHPESTPYHTGFRIQRAEIENVLRWADGKSWSWRALRWPENVRRAALLELAHWDGDSSPLGGGIRYFTADEQSKDVICALAATTGFGCICRLDSRRGRQNWVVNLKVDTLARQLYRKPLRTEYDGEVFCVTVETGFIVVRRNGKVTISGNCEGEKDVETLVRRGIVATTNAQGAGKWNTVADQARAVLLGRNVVIIADADDAGRKHAKQVALSLTGIAATLEVLEPTKGKDVTDHINAGGTYDDLIPLASGVASTPDEEKREDKPVPLPEPLAPNTGQAYKFRIGDHVEIAERLLVLLQNDTRVAITGDEQEIYGYNPVRGLYSQIIKEDQSRIVQTLSGSVVKGKDKPLGIRSVDISGAQRCAYDRVSQPGFFSDAPPGLAFLNGFVTVSENGPTLKAHSPDNRARFGYAFNYDASLPAPMWLTFLGEIFRDDDDRAEKILCLQEHLGASLLGVATTFQKCIVCIGEGDEGKSTFTQIISSAFPPSSIEAIPPQEWGQEYRRAMLAGKLLNTVAELPESDIISSESFKAVIAGDPITGRHIRQAPFTFKPRAGHLFLANRLPGTPDQTRGFWRRFVVIRFNRSFTGDAARDPRIAEKIIAAERSSLVSWALQGAIRLMQQRGHTVPMSHEKELAVWRRNADQIAAFMEDKVVIEPGFGTQASKAYAAYRDWAQANGHFSVSSSKFSARLRELGYPAKKTNVANIYPIVVSGCPREAVEAPGSAVGAAGSKLSPKDPNTYN